MITGQRVLVGGDDKVDRGTVVAWMTLSNDEAFAVVQLDDGRFIKRRIDTIRARSRSVDPEKDDFPPARS